MPAIPFIGPAYQARSNNINVQLCVNLFPELDQQGGKNVAALYGTPGMTKIGETAEFPIARGAMAFGSDGYMFIGQNLHKVDSSLNFTDLFHSIPAGGRVSMAKDYERIMVVDGVAGYLYDPATGNFSTITDVDFPNGATFVTYIDTYFIVNEPGTQNFFICDPGDPTAWDPAKFAAKEGSYDNLVRPYANHRELWLFGENTSEVWYNSGDATFPFERIPGAFMEIGLAAGHTVVDMDNTLFWLAKDKHGDGLVVKAVGYNPQVISTRALEYAISQYSDISDAFAYGYQEGGHYFYVLTFPTGNATWVFDASTSMWHQREYWDSTNLVSCRHRSNCYMNVNGNHVVGDYENGKVYTLDMDTFDDDGSPIRRIRSSVHVHNDRKRISYSKFELDMEFGVANDDVADPVAVLQYSDDGGHTWSNELQAPIGKVGEFYKQVVWYKLGQSVDRVFKVTITDPVKVAIINAHVDIVKAVL